MDFRSIPPQAPGTGSRVSSVVLPLPFNLQAPDLSGYGVRMLNLSTTPSAIAPRAMISPAAHCFPQPVSILQQNPQQLSAQTEEKTHSSIRITYPQSVQAEFIRWKDQFIAGEIEPESEYPDYPVSTRRRTWTLFLKSKWSTYSWTAGHVMPPITTIQQWYTRFQRGQQGSTLATPQRDELRSSVVTCV